MRQKVEDACPLFRGGPFELRGEKYVRWRDLNKHLPWGGGQLMFSKCVVVVDDDINVSDLGEVLFRVTSNVDPKRDFLFSEGPLDALDHSSDRFAFGSKVGIDATRKNSIHDQFKREWPKDLAFPEEIEKRVKQQWSDYGF